MNNHKKSQNTFIRFMKTNATKWPYLFQLSMFDGSLTLLMVGVIYSTQYIVQAIETQNQEMFYHWIYILCGIAVLRLLINVCWKPFIFATRRAVGQHLYEKYMPGVIHSDSNAYEKIGTGKMVAVFSKGMSTRLDTNWTVFGDICASGVTFLAFIITLYMQDITLFWYLMGALGVILIWFSLTGKTAYGWRRKSKENRIDIQRLQVRRFMSKQEILQQDKLDDELAKRNVLNNHWYRHKKIEKFFQGIAFDGSNFVAYAVFVFIVYYSATQVFVGVYSYADFVLIAGLGTTFISELANVLRLYRSLVDKWIDIEKMFELIDGLKSGIDITVGAPYIYKSGDIHVKNLGFEYEEDVHIGANDDSGSIGDHFSDTDQKVFNDFSLHISGGSKIALVGPSGSGKTTLVKLIAGYLRPTSGEIYIDEQRLPGVSLTLSDPTSVLLHQDSQEQEYGYISLKSYYSYIGYLTQEPSVFDGTIRENLMYVVVDNLDEDLLHQAIQDACCDFIYDLPNGLDTEIGERGIRLSGGQRQRLAIAKIFLKNPKIIILDEPTSALDSESEEAVTKAMQRLFLGRTVMIIAHRLQTVKHADRIIYLEDGQILESGTHEELLAKEGKYWKMVELQSGF